MNGAVEMLLQLTLPLKLLVALITLPDPSVEVEPSTRTFYVSTPVSEIEFVARDHVFLVLEALGGVFVQLFDGSGTIARFEVDEHGGEGGEPLVVAAAITCYVAVEVSEPVAPQLAWGREVSLAVFAPIVRIIRDSV